MPNALTRLTALEYRRLHVWLLAAVIGATSFFVWLGYARTLDPTDLGWMWHEDPFTHAMGWEQFRNAPLLQYPITRNELYGLEWSSSVVFTDSIPIVALVLRPFSALLPVPFQYLGWWVLLCLVLQAYFAARLVLLRSDSLRDAALGAVFFVTAPVLLERLGLQTAVGSHWLLLWALLLYLSARDLAPRAWAALLLLTVAVHAYLFVMVGAIWAAHLLSCHARGLVGRRELAWSGGTVVAVLGFMHVLGYFMIGDGAAGGGWRSNFDLIGFIAPSAGARFGLAPQVYDDPWDGSTYLGAGLLVLLVATAILLAARRRRLPAHDVVGTGAPWWPLVLALVGLAAFAITNHITVANETIALLPLPRALEGLYETFRGANRMIWPAYYMIMLATVWLALRVWPRRARSYVLVTAALLQLVDLHGVTDDIADEMAEAKLTRSLEHPIWTHIPSHYRDLVSVPASHRQTDWPTLAWYAARNKMGANIGYLSRTVPAARLAGRRRHMDAVTSGKYDRSTVYYFPSKVLWTFSQQVMAPDDVALTADGFHLILPGARAWWRERDSEPPPEQDALLGEEIRFTSEGHGPGLLLDGWSWPEAWGTWSADKQATLVLPVPANEAVRITFAWRSIMNRARPQHVRVHLGDAVFPVEFPRTRSVIHSTFEVTSPSRALDVRLEIAEQLTILGKRPVGIGLVSAKVERASDPVDAPDVARRAPILDTWISFAADAPGRTFLQRGWSWGEAWGTWSDEPEALLVLPVPANEPLEITFRWLSTAPPGLFQDVRGSLDGNPIRVLFPAPPQELESTFHITSTRNYVVLHLIVDRPVYLADERMLGVGLKKARVRIVR